VNLMVLAVWIYRRISNASQGCIVLGLAHAIVQSHVRKVQLCSVS
jgi:hypothetical protein